MANSSRQKTSRSGQDSDILTGCSEVSCHPATSAIRANLSDMSTFPSALSRLANAAASSVSDPPSTGRPCNATRARHSRCPTSGGTTRRRVP
eukprot:2114559-Prymnesium_polylepis.1